MSALRQDPATHSFGSALREAREHGGHSQDALSARLRSAGTPISKATISAWERGHHQPHDLKWVDALERALGLARGALAMYLGVQGVSRDVESRDLWTVLPPDATGSVTVKVDEHIWVGDRGLIHHIDVNQRIRAVRSGVTSYWFRYWEDPAVGRVRVTAGPGCELGNPRPLAAGRAAVELRLSGHPMEAGEERGFRFTVGHQYFRMPERRYVHQRVSTPTLESYGLRATFPVPDVLVRCCTWIGRDASPLVERVDILRGCGTRTMRWDGPLTADSYGITWVVPT